LRRDQATWIYSQGAPGVYDGDLAFYSDEFEASAHTPHIDTRRTPLWLLTGDYDYSASPAETQKVAAEIEGARFVRLEGFGHFPMTENPHRLQQNYLQPALSDLHAFAMRQKG
jgi:pimeloyl-ACP methyl ester carboxylesterase